MPRAAKPPAGPEPLEGMWRVLSRVTYTLNGDEFIAGPGEVIDGAAAAQVDPDSIEPAE